MTQTDLDRAFKRVRRVMNGAALPGVEESLWYGTPSLEAGGKSFARLKDAETLVILLRWRRRRC